MIWPLIPFSYDTINYDLPSPAPSPPSRVNWLGTDDQGRDVLARLIYGFRISVLFGLTLTAALLGDRGRRRRGPGLFRRPRSISAFQRFIEIWSGLPVLYLLIIMASFIEPNFWWLLGLMLLFSWMGLVDVVRAEFLRARNFDYVRAARALGVSDLDHHPAPRAAQRDGGDDHLSAVHPERLDHHPDLARFSRLRRCRPARRRSANCWRRARPICRRPGSG